MKYRNIAVIVVSMVVASAAHAQSSVTLFGLIDTSVAYSSSARTNAANPAAGGGTQWQMFAGSVYTPRWGLRGSEDLGGGLSAVFWLENGFNSANGTFRNGGDLFGRQAWVGLSARQYGTLTLGRQYDFMVSYLAPLSATGSGFAGNLAEHPYDNDNLNNDLRLNNSVKFSSVEFNGLKFGAMYAFSNQAGEVSNNNAYSAGLSYAFGPLNLAAAYMQINRNTNAQNANGAVSTGDGDALTIGGLQRMYGLGAHYAFGKSTVGLLWTHSSTESVSSLWFGGSTSNGALPGPSNGAGNDIKFDNFEVNGRYFVRPDFSLGASYTYTTASFTSSNGNAHPHWNQVTAQADYLFSQRTDVYLEGVYQRVGGGNGISAFDAGVYTLTPATGNQQVVVAVGLKHRF
ncbi:porin [Paraburkholderia sp. CNPSo 3272]|uniref:porin n=1 Tax=Paraburkholderia sp. CNPSo 3272 TaxID=2940931 RepID=UPI0020B88639|nr:porin [Paraburkholderia sp. CNPSo 3272]MCP3725151.1 porin [Paraburkholderia sp. CNPSo 3272]